MEILLLDGIMEGGKVTMRKIGEDLIRQTRKTEELRISENKTGYFNPEDADRVLAGQLPDQGFSDRRSGA